MIAEVRPTVKMTGEAFAAFIAREHPSDRRYELINGELYEVPTNPLASMIAMLIGASIIQYLRSHNIGYVTGADGGYSVGNDRYVPDVAFISHARQPELSDAAYNPNPPDLAVEVVSDEGNATEQRKLLLKVTAYLAVGTVVWVVYPTSRTVDVHRPGQGPATLDETGTLTAAVLPGFALPLKDIFPQRPQPSDTEA